MERVFMMDSGDGLRRADNGCLGKGPTAKTADYTIKNTDTGTIFTNAGAGGAVTFTLPAAKKGMWFLFLKAAAQNLLLQAPSGSKVGGSNAGKVYKNVTGGDAGSGSCRIVCDGTDWYVIGQTGTWAVDNA